MSYYFQFENVINKHPFKNIKNCYINRTKTVFIVKQAKYIAEKYKIK